MTDDMKPKWHIDAGDEWRQPRVLDWSGKVVAVLPEESEHAALIAAAPDLLAALTELLGAGEAVLAGLNARIDVAPSTAKPVFDGIVALHDALPRARAAISRSTTVS